MKNANWSLSSLCVWLSEKIRDGIIPKVQVNGKKILKVIDQEYYSVFGVCFVFFI